MVFEVSVSSNYSISNFCYPHDPINDLSFRISRMLDLGCFLLQDGSRIGYCESFESVYHSLRYIIWFKTKNGRIITLNI